MERYRGGVKSHTPQKDKVSFKVKFIRQSIVCGVIFLIVAVICALNTKTAQCVKGRIASTLLYTVDYKGAVFDITERIRGNVR